MTYSARQIVPAARSRGLRLLAGTLLCVVLALFAQAVAWAAPPPAKVALIIANGRYLSPKAPPLANPIADGRLIAKTLTAIGFHSVTVVENANKAQMEQALRAFSTVSENAEVALVYYAGHGVEINHVNYLIPVDATIDRDVTVELETVKLDTVLQMSDGAKRLRIVILDACRNNPFLSGMKRSISIRAVGNAGLAPIEPIGDSLVVYSAKAGATALDGAGANSPFASALSRRLAEPGREINLLFRKVRDDVLKATDGGQEPFTYGSLSSEEFYFLPGAATRVASPLDLENEAWTLCRDGRSRGPCDAYLGSFARGRFAALAQTKLLDFASKPSPAPAENMAVAQSAAVQVSVASLGMTMQEGGGDRSVRVRSIDPRGPASGEIFVGDEILSVDAIKANGAAATASQIADAISQGRVKLLIKRGPTTTVVVLRQE